MIVSLTTKVAHGDLEIVAINAINNLDIHYALDWIRRTKDAHHQLIITCMNHIIARGWLAEAIVSAHESHDKPVWEPSRRRLCWPNGATALFMPADDPVRFKGLLCDAFWAHEPEAWESKEDAWNELMYRWLRSEDPKALVTCGVKTLGSFVDFFVKNTPGLVKEKTYCPTCGR